MMEDQLLLNHFDINKAKSKAKSIKSKFNTSAFQLEEYSLIKALNHFSKKNPKYSLLFSTSDNALFIFFTEVFIINGTCKCYFIKDVVKGLHKYDMVINKLSEIMISIMEKIRLNGLENIWTKWTNFGATQTMQKIRNRKKVIGDLSDSLIHMENLQSMFLIYGVCLGLSILLFITEIRIRNTMVNIRIAILV